MLALLLLVTICSVTMAQEWSETTVGDMTLRYAIDGDDLLLEIAAPTRGWVALGFEPTRAMAGANILIGYVDGSGSVSVEDHFGDGLFTHRQDTRLGGTRDVAVIGGSESSAGTVVTFSIPLDSGDQYDKTLEPDTTVHVILAWGANDNISRRHRRRYSTTIHL
jgi:hypothetical protein